MAELCVLQGYAVRMLKDAQQWIGAGA